MTKNTVQRTRSLNEVAAKYWKSTICRLSWVRRVAWLATPEAIAALGARRCRQLRKDLDHQRRQAAAVVPSAAWLDAILNDHAPFPPVDPPRASRSGMVLNEIPVRLGDGPATRRWTPAPAADLEDHLDALTEREALFYDFPASPSAVAIIRIAESGGRESRRHLHR